MTKTLTRDQVLNRAEKMLESLFKEVGFIDDVRIKKEIRKGQGPDFVVELVGDKKVRVILVEARTSGEPRLAREAVNSLLVEMALWSYAYPVFMAPYISRKAAEICTSKGIGYMDLAGNCCLSFDTIFIRSEGNANLFKAKRKLKTLTKPQTSRIIRVLLNNPLKQWQTQELAMEAGVSMGLVSNVKKILKDKEWIDEEKRKIVLVNPQALLKGWVDNAPDEPAEPIEFYNSPLNFLQIENAIVEYCRQNDCKCAFTGFSGAVHLVSDIDYRQIQAYILGSSGLPEEKLGFERAQGGKADIALIRTNDEGLFYASRPVMPLSRLQYYRPAEKTIKAIEEEIKTSMHIVSPVQIYFDLSAKFRSTGREAEKVFHQVLQPSW